MDYLGKWKDNFFFFVAFGFAELHPFIKSFVLIFPL